MKTKDEVPLNFSARQSFLYAAVPCHASRCFRLEYSNYILPRHVFNVRVGAR